MRRLTALLALLTSLFAPRAHAADVPTSAERYYVGDWSWCDVHLLARHWQVSDEEASARLSRKLDDSLADAARSARDAARAGIEPSGWAVCPYFEVYSYADAEALASVWGGSIEDAKARLEGALLDRQEHKVQAELKAAATPGFGSDQGVELDPVTEFYEYGFTYCDAEVLAATWKKEVWDAKVWIGERKIEGDWLAVTKKMDKARKKQVRNKNICQFDTLGYSVQDADTLAEAWGITRAEAMSRIEDKARRGERYSVDMELERLRGAAGDGG